MRRWATKKNRAGFVVRPQTDSMSLTIWCIHRLIALEPAVFDLSKEHTISSSSSEGVTSSLRLPKQSVRLSGRTPQKKEQNIDGRGGR